MAARLAANVGFCETRTRDEILGLLERYDLPTHIPRGYSAEQILDAMGTDKKIQDGKLRLILAREIGKVEIVTNVRREAIVEALKESY